MTGPTRWTALAAAVVSVVLAQAAWFPVRTLTDQLTSSASSSAALPPAALSAPARSPANFPAALTPAALTPAALTPAALSPAAIAEAAGGLGSLPSGPVIAANMPDPSVLHLAGTYYLYATQGNAGNVQTATSTDLRNWTRGPDALPSLGRWARVGRTWAPEVLAAGTGFLLFYTAVDRVSGLQCIGRAVARGPAGPFADDSGEPLVCQRNLGGSIDPDPVVEDGRITLYWKNDGNCCGVQVRLWGQELDVSTDLELDVSTEHLVGVPVPLLASTAPWQGDLIEAPEMFVHAGRHYLFYAANDFTSAAYAEGFATCATALGPCVDGSGPILTSRPEAIGPGHAFVLDLGDRTVLVFHAWSRDLFGLGKPVRSVWTEPVSWADGAPDVWWPPPPAVPFRALGPPG